MTLHKQIVWRVKADNGATVTYFSVSENRRIYETSAQRKLAVSQHGFYFEVTPVMFDSEVILTSALTSCIIQLVLPFNMILILLKYLYNWFELFMNTQNVSFKQFRWAFSCNSCYELQRRGVVKWLRLIFSAHNLYQQTRDPSRRDHEAIYKLENRGSSLIIRWGQAWARRAYVYWQLRQGLAALHAPYCRLAVGFWILTNQ